MSGLAECFGLLFEVPYLFKTATLSLVSFTFGLDFRSCNAGLLHILLKHHC